MSKKMLFGLGMILMLGFGAMAQQYTILVQPAGSKDWGYCDLSGNLIIDAKYKKCIGFSEDGLAAIYDAKLKQFYFINVQGETLPTEVVDFKLIEVFGFGMKGFRGGFAAVKIGEKWGFLNTEGKLAIPAKYDKVTLFDGGFTSAQRDDKFYTLDLNGNEYPVDVPGLADLNDFSEQLASFKTDAGKVGFVNGSGTVVIQPQFQAAGDFHGGLAWAKDAGGLVGYINPQGDWIIKPMFEAGKNYDAVAGLARIKTPEKWGYVNTAGDVTYINDSDLFEDFFDGVARGRKDGKFGYFNEKMEWLVQPQFDGARDFKNGYGSVKVGELWGVIDKTGNWIIQPRFLDIKDVEIVR